MGALNVRFFQYFRSRSSKSVYRGVQYLKKPKKILKTSQFDIWQVWTNVFLDCKNGKLQSKYLMCVTGQMSSESSHGSASVTLWNGSIRKKITFPISQFTFTFALCTFLGAVSPSSCSYLEATTQSKSEMIQTEQLQKKPKQTQSFLPLWN